MNPLLGIQVGMTRAAVGSDDPPWLPEQRVDLDTMLACYTLTASQVNFPETTTGSLGWARPPTWCCWTAT